VRPAELVDLASRLGQYEARVSVQAGRQGALPAALRRVRQGGKSRRTSRLGSDEQIFGANVSQKKSPPPKITIDLAPGRSTAHLRDVS
jgi:hypothetical protein